MSKERLQKALDLVTEAIDSIDGNKDGMDAVIGILEEATWELEALIEGGEM
jgi:hypothetical protein